MTGKYEYGFAKKLSKFVKEKGKLEDLDEEEREAGDQPRPDEKLIAGEDNLVRWQSVDAREEYER